MTKTATNRRATAHFLRSTAARTAAQQRILRTLPQPGTTYFICTSPYDGWVKIGRTTGEPKARLRDLQCGNPRPLSVRASLDIDIEWHLHQLYAEFRGSGEWFALPRELIDFVWQKARNSPNPVEAMIDEWPPQRVWELHGGYRGNSGPNALSLTFAKRS